MSEWRAVVGFSDYEVSSDGMVRRVAPGRGARPGHILAPHTTATGYRQVALRRNGRTFSKLVCQLVCEAFHGNRPDGQEVRHLDGDSQRDASVNLAWGTRLDNAADMRRHGTHRNAAKTHCVNGHAFTPENTNARGNGGRRCRACALESSRRSKARLRASSAAA